MKDIIVLSGKDRELLRIRQIEMLKIFVDICKKNKLQYFIVEGTALGAVRHHGYIPWDDDIDVALPRNDYEQFVSVAKKELNYPYFLQDYSTDKDYRLDYAKIRNSDTTYIEYTAQNLLMNHGIYIDVFPIDGYPDNIISLFFLNMHKKVAKCYTWKDFLTNTSEKKSVKKRVKEFITKVIYFKKPTCYAIKNLEKHYKRFKYEDYNNVVCHGGAWGKREICPKAHYGKGVNVEFEGLFLTAPELLDEYLKHKYDDYMEWPPIEEQKPHHYCVAFSADRSYKEILESARK